MFLWEQHNKAVEIQSLKDGVIRYLKQESPEDIGFIFVPLLRDFFSSLNMKITSNDQDLFQ